MESLCRIGFFNRSFSGGKITSSTTYSRWDCSANLNDADIGSIKRNGNKMHKVCIDYHNMWFEI
jgi:hypothetical protein